jgi:hypothetical protein
VSPAEAKALASQIELHLLAAGDWISTTDLCQRFGIRERSLRQDGRRPGLLDGFAVSSTRGGQSGFCHHRHLPTKEWLPIKHRLRRHAISELRKLRAWTNARTRCLTGQRPTLQERHTGQLLLIP